MGIFFINNTIQIKFLPKVGASSIIILGILRMVGSQTAYRVGQKMLKSYKNKVPLFRKIQQNVIKKCCSELKVMPEYQNIAS